MEILVYPTIIFLVALVLVLTYFKGQYDLNTTLAQVGQDNQTYTVTTPTKKHVFKQISNQ